MGVLFEALPVIFAILPAAAIIAVIYMSYYNVKIKLIKRLRYKREFSAQAAFEGEDITITETIYNNSILPLFFVDVESYIYHSLKLLDHPGGENGSSMQLVISRFHLMPYMQVKRHHRIKCMNRGYYKMDSSCIFTKSVGVEKFTYFGFEAELYVYPKAVEFGHLSYPVNFIQGDTLSRRMVVQDPFSVSGIRDYSAGDPFHMINFKATAKSGFSGMHSIKVNKLDHCSDRIFMIYINFQAPLDILSIPTEIYEALMEQALSFAASFIGKALRKGYRVGLSANCHLASGEKFIAFPIIGGLYHIEDILKKMAAVQIRCGISFSALLEKGAGSDIRDAEIFVITPYIDKNMDGHIASFKNRNNAVTIIELENEEYNKFLGSTSKLRK